MQCRLRYSGRFVSNCEKTRHRNVFLSERVDLNNIVTYRQTDIGALKTRKSHDDFIDSMATK